MILKRFPFDYDDPIGYFIAVVIEYIIIGYELLVVACLSSTGIGAFCIAFTATKEIRRALNLFNDEAQTNDSESVKSDLLAECIDAHGTLKQLS